MFNRLSDVRQNPENVENLPNIEPVPLRTRLLLLGGIALGVTALHIAGLIDNTFTNDIPPSNTSSTELVSYLQEDQDNNIELAVELPLFAAGVTTYLGYLVLSKKPEDE